MRGGRVSVWACLCTHVLGFQNFVDHAAVRVWRVRFGQVLTKVHQVRGVAVAAASSKNPHFPWQILQKQFAWRLEKSCGGGLV
jgi:hypothetical protein